MKTRGLGSLVVLLYSLVLCCGSGSGRPSPELEAFYRLAHRELADPAAERAPEAQAYLAALPPAVRRAAARAIAGDRDPRIQALGIDRLLADGYEDDAVPALAARVVGGDDLTAVGAQWAHQDDVARPLRMYVKICRYLLGRLDTYPPAGRAHAERFLSDGGFAQPLPRFSVAAVEERLRRIEAMAAGRKE